jgi:signal transduction histidine kinase/ligand-binding sensor domain-containing protein
LNSPFVKMFQWLILAALGWPTALWAEGELPGPEATPANDLLIQNWQSDEGLPRNSITALAQDARGYLWMGTPQGLIRFDGARFTAFEAEASAAMARSSVMTVAPDEFGGLWVGTRRGGMFRQMDGRISEFPGEHFPPRMAVVSVAREASGRVWAARGDGLVGRLTPDAFVPAGQLGKLGIGPMLLKLTADRNGGMWFAKQDTFGRLVDGRPTNYTTLSGTVITLAPARDGGIWLSTGFEIRRIRPGETAPTETVARLPSGPYGVSALLEDRAGTLWVGSSKDGLLRCREGRLEKVAGMNFNITDLLEDAEGNLWVGTDGAGLFKLRPRVFRVIGPQEGLPTEAVVSVSGDWVASSGTGFGRLQRNGRVEMVAGLELSAVGAVQEDGAAGVWAGTSAGRVIHQRANGERSSFRLWQRQDGPQVRVLYRDSRSNLWIGGFPSGLFQLPAGEETHFKDLGWRGFSNVAVTAIAESANGLVYVGTSAGELHQLQGEDFQKYGRDQGFTGFPISALLSSTNGALWVGTLGGGLGCFREGKVRLLGERAGLHDDVITQLIEDQEGWLWVSASRGIFRVLAAELSAVVEGRKARATAVHFGAADGLQNVHGVAEHQPAAWRSPAGELRFATSRGVVTFDPAAIPRNSRPPPLNLERVLVDGVVWPDHDAIRLPPDYRKVEFQYTAPSFAVPEKVLFRRRIQGFDGDWVEAGTSRVAIYPHLPPGRYTFQFTACNNDGVWNDEPLRLEFSVEPAYWETAWFRMGEVLVFAGVVGGGVLMVARLRMRRKLARLEQANALERERTRISRDLHDDLGARLTQMALQTDLAADDPVVPAEVRTQIKEVSAQARSAVQSLDETVWMINPRKDTLSQVVAYIAQYAEQFFRATPINCRMDIVRDLPDCSMPGNLRRDILMLVKEALNNAQKHAGASEVRLRVAVRQRILRISIRDNGKGFAADSAKAHRHGLGNIRQRAEAAGIRASIHSRPGVGTLVALRIRLGSLEFRPGRKRD